MHDPTWYYTEQQAAAGVEKQVNEANIDLDSNPLLVDAMNRFAEIFADADQVRRKGREVVR